MKLIQGDCLEKLKEQDDNSIDTIITDPPYGLSFMGKKWDYDVPGVDLWKECLRVLKPGGTALIFAGSRTQHRMAVNVEDAGFILKDCIMWLYGSGFPKATDISKQLDKKPANRRLIELKDYIGECIEKSGKSKKQINEECGFQATSYARKAIRGDDNWGVAIPTLNKWNKMKAVIGIDNTWDCLISEAEREIIGEKKAGIGSGKTYAFADNVDADKSVDITLAKTPEAKLWNGWKSHGLKPSYEPVLVCQKPNDGTYANNALTWGVSGLNIDGGRIGYSEEDAKKNNKGDTSKAHKNAVWKDTNHKERRDVFVASGRFPANIILGCICDEVKEVDDKIAKNISFKENNQSDGWGTKKCNTEEVKAKAQIHTNPDCPCYMLDEQSGVLSAGHAPKKSKASPFGGKNETPREEIKYTKGGASRFFAKIKSNLNSLEISKSDITCKMCGKKKKDYYSSYYVCDDCVDRLQITSRFFYCPKASKAERNAGCEGLEEKNVSSWHFKCNICGKTYAEQKHKSGCQCENPEVIQWTGSSKNNHPTVKPLKLMEYLCTLTKTPTGGLVLDPFMGSGTTGLACKNTGRDFIGIELDEEYIKIANARINAST